MYKSQGKKKGPSGRKVSLEGPAGQGNDNSNETTTSDIVDDPYPQRLTNPLIENQSKSIQDILKITDGIHFSRPDTFPLDFHSRLLGVPLQNNVPADQLIIELPTVPKDAVYDVPKLGPFHRDTLFWTPDDTDETLLRDTPFEFDPLYVSLHQNQPSSIKVVASSSQHAKYLNYKTIVDAVQSADPEPSRWSKYTLQPVATFRAQNPAVPTTFEHGWVATMVDDDTNVAAFIDFQLEWYREADEAMDDSHLIGNIRSIKLNEALPDVAWLRTVMVCLVSTQLRNCCVNYAVYNSNLPGFRMTPTSQNDLWLLDVHKFSTKLALMTYQQGTAAQNTRAVSTQESSSTERWLVNLPMAEEVLNCFLSDEQPTEEAPATANKQLQRRNSSNIYTDCDDTEAFKSIHLQYNMETSELQKVEDEISISKCTVPTFHSEPPSMSIFRNFTLPSTKGAAGRCFGPDPLLDELVAKQKELEDLEKGLQPKLRNLMETIIRERVDYESQESVDRRSEDRRILAQARKMLDTRKALDQARQNKLLQDMEEVCNICNDGEVTPENQIFFCESCNVAIHQMCYGIDRVPEGDYYCLACRRLGKDVIQSRVPPHLRVPLKLGICCELCPLKTGAFIRTAVPKQSEDEPDKFVHVVCRKWMGLSHIDPSTVEDVTETKLAFRRHRIVCDLCKGERGGMVKCKSDENCNKWFHVTCARAIGTMKIVHGENCHGDVEEDGWSLWCTEHSDLPPRAKGVSKYTLSQETLIEYAKEFPPDPRPPLEHRPFNQLDGLDRAELLADPDYERPLMTELLKKRMYGMRCEICNSNDEDTRNLTRCSSCSLVFCASCSLPNEELSKQIYRCPACRFVEGKKKSGEDFETPQCLCCYQKGGFLAEAYARPYKKTYWNKNKEEYKRSVFGRKIWAHLLCGYWHPQIHVENSGKINLSHVLLSDGRGQMFNREQLCFLCGQSGGIKMKCDHPGCCDHGVKREEEGKNQPVVVHATCARQAGLEVRLDDSGSEIYFYVRCYRHGGNEFNLRAQLEDLIEIEKKRAGKDHSKANLPMKFSDGSRILVASIHVMRTLGWAWRWAEWWVDYDSSWEPLLEPGQKEKDMTKEELKIIDSTRESRCDDARRCRLAAFGAAIRNRSYDTNEGFNNEALSRALRAILSTESLVGPLQQVEKDFFVDWLARAYRSKSRLLYFGKDRNEISSKAPFTVHSKDSTTKFELGNRPLPGDQELVDGTIFEDVSEVDDFLVFPIVKDRVVERKRGMSTAKRGPGRPPRRIESVDDESDLGTPTWKLMGWKKPGRRKTKTSSDVFTDRRRRDKRDKKRPGRPSKRSAKRRKTSNGPERRTVSSKVDLRRIGGARSTVIDIVASAFYDSDFSGDESEMENLDHGETNTGKETELEEPQAAGAEQPDNPMESATMNVELDATRPSEQSDKIPSDSNKKDDGVESSKTPSSPKAGLMGEEDEPIATAAQASDDIDDDDMPIADLVGDGKTASSHEKKKPDANEVANDDVSSPHRKPDTPQRRGRYRGKLEAAASFE